MALAWANRGRAADFARVLSEMARRAEPSAVQGGAPAHDASQAQGLGLDEAFLARVAGTKAGSTPQAQPKDSEPASALVQRSAATLVDPLVTPTSSEESNRVGEAFAADSHHALSSDGASHGEAAPSDKLINPLAAEFQGPAIPAPTRASPELTNDPRPPEAENARVGFGKLVDPLAQSGDPLVRPLPDVRTAVDAREWTAADEPVAKGVDRRVSRTSAEAVSEPSRGVASGNVPMQSAPPRANANVPARLAQKQADPYLDAVGPVPSPAPGAMVHGPQHTAPSAYGATTTYIDPNCGETRPVFDFTAEALVWRLEHTRKQPMMVNPVLGQTIFTNALDLGYQAGPRLTMDFLSDEEETIHSFEIGYFGIYNWFDRLTEVAPLGSFLRLPDVLGDPGVTTDFSGAGAMVARYQSRINSVELNVFFGGRDASFHWAIGPRFIRLEENFNLNSFTADRMSFYQVDTMNDLWGVQWVGRWRGTRGCWELTGICKVGIYDNQARQATFMTDDDRTVVLRNFSPSETAASLVVDGGITAAYQFNGTWLARFGYNVFYMDNIARATDQLDFSNNATSGSRLFFRQDALAHGFNCGLEARW